MDDVIATYSLFEKRSRAVSIGPSGHEYLDVSKSVPLYYTRLSVDQEVLFDKASTMLFFLTYRPGTSAGCSMAS